MSNQEPINLEDIRLQGTIAAALPSSLNRRERDDIMMTEIYDGNQAHADIILNPPTERRLISNTEKLQAEQ